VVLSSVLTRQQRAGASQARSKMVFRGIPLLARYIQYSFSLPVRASMLRPLSQVTADIQKELDKISLPDGYHIYLVGERLDLISSKSDLQRALLVAVLGVYLVLMGQFRSFLQSLTIMSAIPLVLAGVALALILAGKPVSMPVLLGLILLACTVVNNSILLVDHVNAAGAGVPTGGPFCWRRWLPATGPSS